MSKLRILFISFNCILILFALQGCRKSRGAASPPTQQTSLAGQYPQNNTNNPGTSPPPEPPKCIITPGTVGLGTASSCTESALDAVLQGNASSINFCCGPDPHTIVISKEKHIKRDLSIDGGNLITISGGEQTRVFLTDSKINFTLQNLTIANGKANGNGAAIMSGYRGKLIIRNCNFINNNSILNGPDEGGGAIYSKSESDVLIENSSFFNNRGANGGAIGNLLSNLTVTNCIFTENESYRQNVGGGGGAIYVDGAKELGSNKTGGIIQISGSQFNKNKALFQGGAIFIQLYNDDEALITKSTIDNNEANGSGNQGFGAGLFYVGDSAFPLESNFTIINSTFSNNKASNQGGGIWMGVNGNMELANSTIANNKASRNNNTEGMGGGIMRTSGKININNCTIAYNSCGSFGGGIFPSVSDITMKNSIVANNTANNGGNNYNIKQNCGTGAAFPNSVTEYMTDGGNNLEFPQINSNDPSDGNCIQGITVADPLLETLNDNGGTTQTIAIKTGSPAINGGGSATCLLTDQRGNARNGNCDIGAYEF